MDIKLNKQALDLLYSRRFIKYSDYLKLIAAPGFNWAAWGGRLLLFLGAALTLAGVICFFAFNWQAMGKILKLGLPFAGFAAFAGAAFYKGLDGIGGKVLSLSAAVFIGIFFAVFGQVYQTGADAWQLFALWAALMLPLAVLTRFSALWLVFLGVFYIFLIFCPQLSFLGKDAFLLLLVAISLAFFTGGEFLSAKLGCLGEGYFKAITYSAALFTLTGAASVYIFDGGFFICFVMFWVLNCAGLYYFLNSKKGITFIGLHNGALALILFLLVIKMFIFFKVKSDAGSYLTLSIAALIIFGAAAGLTVKAARYIKGAK